MCVESYSKFWLLSPEGHSVFGGGKRRLIEEIGRLGFLAAAESLHISYRKAWGDLNKVERAIKNPLILKFRGGAERGSIILTPAGKQILALYAQFGTSLGNRSTPHTKKPLEPSSMKSPNRRLILSLILLWGIFASAAEPLQGTLSVFHAGSLALPFKQIAAEFNQIHPNLRIQLEAAGSRACARKITELHRPCDLLASADYRVIDQLLLPDHATWNLRFAANELCIVYHPASPRASELAPHTWIDILLDPNVAIEHSDPNTDPCGYRTVLTLQLAESHYNRPGIADALLAKDQRFIRPKETDLLALLETHTLDYLFLYRSVARQHGLQTLLLPDEINLKNPALDAWYATASIQLTGKTPSETLLQRGESMVYGLTIPANAPNPRAALAFVQFLLSAEGGLPILERNGQPTLVPAPCPQWDRLPPQLQPYATPTP